MGNRRIRNSRRNKYFISHYWRGDIEDIECWSFPTEEAAWAHVVGEVRKRIKAFKSEETTHDHGPTIIDWGKFKTDLFEKGYGRVEYCQCSFWWDNWEYYKKN